ncbi:MAG TPA: CBS domain-containing protein [Streptosporangiaceae bacterium]|nr:CBS domain-containing protein [Streptosporangiaceae bacterium]
MHRTLVRDVMSTEVTAVGAATPFKHLVTVLRSKHADAVLVVDPAGRPEGIITPADLIIRETDPQGAGPRGAGPRGCPDESGDRRKATGAIAAELMSAPPVTVFPHTTVTEAAQVMRRHAIAQLPVIEPATGRMVGLMTRSDALNAYLRRDDDIQEEIRREILGGEFATDTADVTVTTICGVVRLNGHVRRHDVVSRLVCAVREVEGVVRVEEHLRCRGDDRFPVPPLAW